MDEVFDTEFLEVFHAGRSASHNKNLFARANGFEGSRSEFGVFVVARAENDDVGTSLASSRYAIFYGLETEVVDDLIASASKEVARELSASQTHGQVADGEHEHFWTFARAFGLEAQCFELLCSTNMWQRFQSAFGSASAAAFALFEGDFVGSLLVEVRELVCAKQNLFASRNIFQTFFGSCFHIFLNATALDGSEESAILLNLEEAFPSLIGNVGRECLDVVRTSGRIGYFVEMRLLFEQQLLIASNAFREIVRFFVGDVERIYRE